ncbi:MAG: sugar phosphate isomerase/epimerase [Eubacterium sp.]|jgi:sugar phosphate isomerase/epimerase|nr:sugar phosphate isomerase/epimerase [Eubacterium sp.]
MINIGLRLHDGEKRPLNELLPLVREMGFKCAHIALKKSISEYSVATTSLTPGYGMHLKNLFSQNNIDVSILGCYLDISSETTDIERYLAHIRIASIIGAGIVGTETNGNGGYETLVKNLKTVVSYAEKLGVIFAIEPVAKHVINTPEMARKILDEIKSPNLGIIFDPVNLLSINNYNEREQIHNRAIELLDKEIMAVHIKDFIVKDGELESVAVGEGKMNYRSILKYLKNSKPFIHATLENTKPGNSAKAREFVEKLLLEV